MFSSFLIHNIPVRSAYKMGSILPNLQELQVIYPSISSIECFDTRQNVLYYSILYNFYLIWFGLWCLAPLSTIYLFIVAVSCIGGYQSTRRKPSTCRKSLINFIT